MFVAVQDSCTYAGTKLCLNDHYLCETFCLGWTIHHWNTTPMWGLISLQVLIEHLPQLGWMPTYGTSICWHIHLHWIPQCGPGNKAADGALYASHTPCPSRLQHPWSSYPTRTKREENPPLRKWWRIWALLLLCIQWQVPVPQDLQHAKLSPQSAQPFVWILLQGSPPGCYKSPATPWTPSLQSWIW